MFAKLINHNNDDLTVVNAARVSFGKKSDSITDKDIKLINYLKEHKHFTPFTHNFHTVECTMTDDDYKLFVDFICRYNNINGLKFHLNHRSSKLQVGFNVLTAELFFSEVFPEMQESVEAYLDSVMPHSIGGGYAGSVFNAALFKKPTEDSRFLFDTIHLKVPFFVARQLDKHQVGFTRNEISRRYVDDKPETFVPESWRKRAKDKKQGSLDEEVKCLHNDERFFFTDIKASVRNLTSYSLTQYGRMIKSEVAPEQARMILPMSTYTEYWLSACLEDWFRLLDLRLKSDTQKETRDVAAMIRDELKSKHGTGIYNG